MSPGRQSSRGRSRRLRPQGPGRSLYLDCFSGAAGNMILGALLDLGASARAVRAALGELGIEGLRMRVSSARRGAIQATYVSFKGPTRSAKERRLPAIRTLIDRADLAPRVRERACATFERLAVAEAKVHGIEPEQVHFHEVGAADAIGDIVGACAALEDLGVDRLTASPLPLGRGRVQSDHGPIPLPAPATVELLVGVPTRAAEVEWETVTPTGAALLAALCDDFGAMPPLEICGQGFGAGDDRKGPLPNVLRAVLGMALPVLEGDVVSVLETNVDDTSPEHLPFLLERLLDDGALDASLSPLLMKKGRPGQLLRVIARPSDRERLARRILAESSTLGVRSYETSRLKLPREQRTVTTEFGRVQVKLARHPDGAVTAAPEFDACARLARKHDVPLARVYEAAERAAREQAP